MSELVRSRILLVEDEAILALDEKMQLEKYGYEVRTVTTGEKAVDTVNASSDIDLILMDIDLGKGIDGTQAAELILKEQDIPIVFLSSHTEPEIVEKTEKISSYGYVVKSSSITVLDASIKMAFRLFDAMTREKVKEESLRKSEQKYKTLFNEMLDGFALHEIICDAAGAPIDYRFLDVNPVFERMTGLKASDIIGRTVLEVLPETESYWIETYGKVALSGEPVVFENSATALGKAFNVKAFCPAVNHFACIFEDTTERKQVEEQLREKRELATRIIEDGPVAITQVDRNGVITLANQHAERLLELEDSEVGGLRYNSPEWKITDVDGGPFPDERLPFSQVMSTGEAVFDVQHAISKSGVARKILSINGAPLHNAQGELNGAVFTMRDITKSKQFEQELTRQKLYLERILETTSDGFWIVTPEKRITEVNTAYCRMSGYSKDELRLMEVNDLDAIESPGDSTERIERIMRNGSEIFETKHRRKDGSLFDVELSVSRMDQNDGGYLVCFCRDITQRKKMRQELEDSRKQYEALVERFPDIIYIFGTKSGAIFWSEASRRILGIDPEDIVADPFLWNRSIHAEDKPLVEKAIAGAINGEPFDIEYRIETKDGNWVWLRDKLVDRTEKEGETIIQGHAEDITERKKDRRELSEKTSLFNEVLNNMLDLVAITNLDGDFLYAGRSHERLGYSVSSLIGRNVMEFVHPDDLDYVTQKFSEFVRSRNDSTVEYRYRCSDGTYVWLETTGRLLQNENEEPARILFNTRDVTERKQTEQAIIEKTNLLEESQTLANLGSWEWDIASDTWHFSAEWKEIHGLSDDYLDTPNLVAIAHPEDVPSIEKAFTEAREHGTTYDIEHRIIRASDGEIRHIKASGKVELDQETRRAIRMVGVAQDITKQKQTENEVRQLLSEKEVLINEIQHRIKNNINTIMSVLSLQAQMLDEPTAIAALSDAKSRVNSLNELYGYLYRAGSVGEGSLQGYLQRLIASEVEFFPLSTQLALHTEIEERICSTKTLSILGLIVNELITNAMKYAFQDHSDPKLTVTGAHHHGHYVLTIEDNGPGIPDSQADQSSSGFGFMMVNGLAEQLGGTIQFENANGTRAKISFPTNTEL